jgi:hypothetical protein
MSDIDKLLAELQAEMSPNKPPAKAAPSKPLVPVLDLGPEPERPAPVGISSREEQMLAELAAELSEPKRAPQPPPRAVHAPPPAPPAARQAAPPVPARAVPPLPPQGAWDGGPHPLVSQFEEDARKAEREKLRREEEARRLEAARLEQERQRLALEEQRRAAEEQRRMMEEQRRQQEARREQERALAQARQREQEDAQNKKRALVKKAEEYVKGLKPGTTDAKWFESFAKGYPSKIDAAIAYLEAMEET